MERMRRTINAALAVTCLAFGSVVCAWLISTKPAPPRRSIFARPLGVAVSPVGRILEATPVVGHGTVRPKHQVKIVPQVSGRLVYALEDLAPGKIIPEGELLFEIDPTVYESRVRQAEAETRRLEASLERADQEMTNLDERIVNAEQMLAIDQQDYITSKRLHEIDEVGTQRDVDLVHQKLLRQKDALIELKSRRSVIPYVKLETQAQLEAARAHLGQATYDLENTKIFCPFDARVELAAAYESQVVTAHFSIATLTDMSAFELSVGIDPRELRWLDQAIRPSALEREEEGPQPEVRVSWSLHGQEFTWRGFVTRFERVDEATRTARLAVEIRDVDMVATVALGSDESSPTLAIGMHCRVELPVEPLTGALLIPRHAIYDNRWAYVFEPDPDSQDHRMGLLGRREVPMLRSVGDAVLVDYAGREGTEVCELGSDERVVVSPLVKPVVGMRIRLRDEQVASAVTLPTIEPSRRLQPARTSTRPEDHGAHGSYAAVMGQLDLSLGGG